MSVMLLTQHHLEYLSLKGGYTGSSESTLVKMPHCWKSHVTAQPYLYLFQYFVFLVIVFTVEAAAGIIGFLNYDKVGYHTGSCLSFSWCQKLI